jgi:hypothetical protein
MDWPEATAAPQTPTEKRRWFDPRGQVNFDPMVIIAFGLVIPLVLGTSATIFEDGDVSWHIATGQWMLANAAVPYTDPFSFSAFGKPWVAHEWLSELIMGGAYELFGYAGIGLLTVVALSALLLLVGLELRRWLDPLRVGLILTALTVVLIPYLHARPMVLTWPLIGYWTLAMMRARDREQAPPWWLAFIMLLWVNLHASFALGLLISAAFALEALVAQADKTRAFIAWGSFGLLCVAATLVNPNGYTSLLIPLGAFTSPNITLIQEFKPTLMTASPGFELALLLLLGLCLWRGVRVPAVRVLIILGMLHLALSHMRHQTLFMIVVPLLLAGPLARSGEERRSLRRALGFEDQPGRFVAGLVALPLVLSLLALATTRAPVDSPVNATTAFAHIPAALRSQPVLNSYRFGGPLILRNIRPFIDGRTDVYGDPFVVNFQRLLNGDKAAFDRAQAKWGFRWAIIARDDRKLMALVANSAGWRPLYQDRRAVIFVREAS